MRPEPAPHRAGPSGPLGRSDLKGEKTVIGQQLFHDKRWSLIVAQAWADEDFKSRLLSNPKAVMREYGLEMAPKVQVKVLEDTDQVLEDTDQVIHFTFPANPSGELSEEELPVAVAQCHGCHGCHGCRGCHCGCHHCGCGCGGCGGCA